jgi:hypothetical protein
MQTMTLDEQEYHRYESRLKAQRDYYSGLSEARQEGLQLGRQEGRREAMTESLVREIRVFERVLRRPVTPADQLFSKPLAELERLAQELEAVATGESPPAE